jgi:hypothetical protein
MQFAADFLFLIQSSSTKNPAGTEMHQAHKCRRCGHSWFDRLPLGRTPVRCASCRSPYWSKPYVRNILESRMNPKSYFRIQNPFFPFAETSHSAVAVRSNKNFGVVAVSDLKDRSKQTGRATKISHVVRETTIAAATGNTRPRLQREEKISRSSLYGASPDARSLSGKTAPRKFSPRKVTHRGVSIKPRGAATRGRAEFKAGKKSHVTTKGTK